MLEKSPPLREFHAGLREVEDGLYLAEYSGEINPKNPDAREIPDRHVGPSAQESETMRGADGG